MKTVSSTTGYVVEELEEGVDTLDLEITGLDPEAERWEALANAYAENEHCPSCMFDERGIGPITGRPWRECAALHWSHCPARIKSQSLLP